MGSSRASSQTRARLSHHSKRCQKCGGVLLARGPSSSTEMRGLVIHDIKEVEGVRQQEEQEDKRDEEIGDEVNGEVEGDQKRRSTHA